MRYWPPSLGTVKMRSHEDWGCKRQWQWKQQTQTVLKRYLLGPEPFLPPEFSILPSPLPFLMFQRKTKGSSLSHFESFTVALRQTHMCSKEKCAVSRMTQEKLSVTGSVRIVFIGNSSKSSQFRFYVTGCVSPSGVNLVPGHRINRTEAISVPPYYTKCSLLKLLLFMSRFTYVLRLTAAQHPLVDAEWGPTSHSSFRYYCVPWFGFPASLCFSILPFLRCMSILFSLE